MVLFSLNGLCPDDNEHGFGNNTFSNKNCVIIEPLEHHINETISLVPTDTAIKGDVYLSNDAIILIKEEDYKNLTEEQKNALNNLNCSVKAYNGLLKEVVFNELAFSERYIPEELSLSSSNGGIKDSVTSEEQKKCINDIAKEYGLLQMKFFNLLSTNDTSLPKYEEVSSEYHNLIKIQEYYMILFLEELLEEMNASDYYKNEIENNLYNKEFMEKITEMIKIYGIDNYKKFVDGYNQRLEEKQQNHTLLTPQEIVDSIDNNLTI